MDDENFEIDASYDVEDENEMDDFPEPQHVNTDRLPLVPIDFSNVSEALQNFTAVFESRFGGLHPRFQTISLSSSLKEAFTTGSVIEQKPLAIYLHHDDAVACNIFASQVICYEAISSLLSAQFVVWPWDMTHSENRLKFFEWLTEANLNEVRDMVKHSKYEQYPLLVLVIKERTQYSVATIAHGTDDPDSVIEKIMTCLDQFQLIKSRQITEENNRAERERIRNEQVDEYERSKAIDRERVEEQKRQRQKEMDEQAAEVRRAEEDEKRRAEIASTLPVEPAENAADIVTIRFRLPSGAPITRRFSKTEPVIWVERYLASLGYDPETYRIWTSDYPRKDFGTFDTSKTFAELAWPAREQLTVEEK